MVTRRGALALILTILLVAACAGGDSEGGDTTVGGTTDGATTTAGETTETTEATGTTAGGEELPTLHIGIPLPFTGVVAESAEEMRQTFEMYIEQQGGTLGGLPVEVTFEDTETDAELVVTKTRKLIDEDQVHLLSGPMLAFEGLAMLDSVNQAGIALVGHVWGSGRRGLPARSLVGVLTAGGLLGRLGYAHIRASLASAWATEAVRKPSRSESRRL